MNARDAEVEIPSLLYTDVQEELRGSVRELLADRSPVDKLIAKLDSGDVVDRALWHTLAADLGCAGLAVPEVAGGAGASWSEVAVVAEELGRAVAPVPFLGSSVLATSALLAAEEGELLGEVATGERTAVLAVPFGSAPGGSWPVAVRAEGATLTGAIAGIADAGIADDVLVPVVEADGPALFAVPAAALWHSPVTTLDETRPLTDLTLDGVEGRRLVGGADAELVLNQALTIGAAILASEQLGLAERAIETTVGYLRERHQFGRPIGSFQALKHRMADLWVAVSQGRAVARYAASCAAEGNPDLPIAARMAKAYLSPVVVRACEEMVQMHGGIGFTWEHPAHVYLKRAKSSALALGTATRHRSDLAHLVDLPNN
jgi:alkylation response protein AidB-like acyl-CoA dehydrogenase